MMPRPESRRRYWPYVTRNRGGLLVGITWVHQREWPVRHLHVYLGWWVLTLQWQHTVIEEQP